MNKYEPLTAYLKTQQVSHYPIHFREIEKVIEDRLPPSAYKYRAWWSNNPNNNVMTRAWLDAGWITSDVDLEGQKLVFRRARPQPPAPGTAPAAPKPANTAALNIAGLSPATLANLRARAELSGQTVEDAAREVLEHHAKVTMAERLALADRLRAASPRLHHVDAAAMIRQDRDAR